MKVLLSDLDNANSSSGIKSLNKIMETSNNLNNCINNFINVSQSNFKGAAYNAIRNKLSLYQEALKKLSNMCEILRSNTVAANNIMISYMMECSCFELDDSFIPELEKEKTNAQVKLNSLIKPSFPLSLDKEVRANYKAAMDEYEYQRGLLQELIRKIDEDIEKLKGLAPTDNSAFAVLQSVEGDIGNLSNAINSIDVTNI